MRELPTEMGVIYAAINQLLEIMAELELSYIFMEWNLDNQDSHTTAGWISHCPLHDLNYL